MRVGAHRGQDPTSEASSVFADCLSSIIHQGNGRTQQNTSLEVTLDHLCLPLCGCAPLFRSSAFHSCPGVFVVNHPG